MTSVNDLPSKSSDWVACRQTIFLPVVGLVDPDTMKPGDLVGVNKDSYLILDTLPSEYDSRVKAMEVRRARWHWWFILYLMTQDHLWPSDHGRRFLQTSRTPLEMMLVCTLWQWCNWCRHSTSIHSAAVAWLLALILLTTCLSMHHCQALVVLCKCCDCCLCACRWMKSLQKTTATLEV